MTRTLVVEPANRENFNELWPLCVDALEIVRSLGVEPVMNASMAVLAYCQDPTLEVHDIDLSCSGAYFDAISELAATRQIDCELQEWGVLELHRGHVKVEFDEAEQWMQGLRGDTETVLIRSTEVTMVSRADLATLYQRGVDAYAGRGGDEIVARHLDLSRKLAMIRSGL